MTSSPTGHVKPGLMLLSLLLAGCAAFHDHGGGGDSERGPTVLIFSPNGEPLNGGPFGRPSCEVALTRWFERADSNHDGVLGHGEFMADAAAQFARMDIDHNGYLLSEELERYRLPYRQMGPVVRHVREPAGDGEAGEARRRRVRPQGTDEAGERGRGVADMADPVMSADLDNDFKVTSEEFRFQAERVFGTLDTAHNGRVTLEAVLKTCARYEARR